MQRGRIETSKTEKNGLQLEKKDVCKMTKMDHITFYKRFRHCV
jgi:hypothetical protein